jgi:hypothetical protein
MVVQYMILAWEDAYRKYESAEVNDVGAASRAVATAWQELAEYSELPWWLCAAVRSAAQAFEHQAQEWDPVQTPGPTVVPVDDENMCVEPGPYEVELFSQETRRAFPVALRRSVPSSDSR